jgi:2-oxoisovalerate dehydrogenase E2 component (dihydrolipoyl transacylase)
MARFTFRLPDIGEGIAEAEIVAWHVKIGDKVSEDQQVADMMTDKATVEMESPVTGMVVELAGEVGDQVAIGSALMVIETDRGRRCRRDSGRRRSRQRRRVSRKLPRPKPLAPPGRVGRVFPRPAPGTCPSFAALFPRRAPEKHVLASPAVRARAKDLGIDLAVVKADGNRVRHADLDAYLRYGRPGLSRPARQPRPRG